RHALVGAGAGGGAALALSLLLKRASPKWAPWWGAAAVGAAGTMFTISPYGENLRNMGWDIMKTPYRDWSDFSAADMPAEGIGIYTDFAVGTKGMTGVMDGIRIIGALEFPTRVMSWAGTTRYLGWVGKMGNYKASSSLVGAGIGAFSGYDLSSKKDKTTIFRDV